MEIGQVQHALPEREIAVQSRQPLVRDLDEGPVDAFGNIVPAERRLEAVGVAARARLEHVTPDLSRERSAK